VLDAHRNERFAMMSVDLQLVAEPQSEDDEGEEAEEE
jgi:hypothetical protein